MSIFLSTFLSTLPQQIWFVFMILTCGYALWRGGGPERLVSVACIVAWLASALTYNYQSWVDPQWVVLGVDIALLTLLLALAASTNRNWTLFSAAFQLLAVVIHVAIIVDPEVRGRPYVQGLVIWSYLNQIALAVGTRIEVVGRRRRAALTP